MNKGRSATLRLPRMGKAAGLAERTAATVEKSLQTECTGSNDGGPQTPRILPGWPITPKYRVRIIRLVARQEHAASHSGT
jgi:hypothetical protein